MKANALVIEAVLACDLCAQARASAEAHGHSMCTFRAVQTATRTLYRSECEQCGAYVDVDPHPPANGLEIGGDVFGRTCA